MIFINRDRQSLGQFSEQDVANGLKSGRFLPNDLAWREPMVAWQLLSSFTDLPVPADVPPEPKSPPIPGLQATGKIEIGLCLSEGWACFQRHGLLLVLGTVVFFAISLVFQIPQEIAQSVALPLIKNAAAKGALIAVAAGGVWFFFFALYTAVATLLGGGFFFFFIEALRKGPTLGTIFCAFRKPTWLQLILATLAYTAAFLMLLLVVVGPGALVSVKSGSPIPLIISGIVFAIPAIYIGVAWAYTFPLIIDRRIAFWEAMELSRKTVQAQWLQVFSLVFVSGLVMMSGVLLCLVGLLVTLPLGYLFVAQGYRQLFGDYCEGSMGVSPVQALVGPR